MTENHGGRAVLDRRAEDLARVHGGRVGEAKRDQVAGDQLVLGVQRQDAECLLRELAHVGAHGVCAGGSADKGGRGFADLHGVYGQGQHGVPFCPLLGQKGAYSVADLCEVDEEPQPRS